MPRRLAAVQRTGGRTRNTAVPHELRVCVFEAQRTYRFGNTVAVVPCRHSAFADVRWS